MTVIAPAPAVGPNMASVIIGTRDRAADIARCLPGVLAIDDYFEIIVADQSADTATEEVVARLSDPRLVFLRIDTVGKSHALNVALRRARGDIIAFTDDDCAVPTDWITRARKALSEDGGVSLVFGGVAAVPHDPTTQFIPTFVPQAYRLVRGPAAAHRLGIGANMLVRRDVFARIGGFDESLGPGATFKSAEECDLAYRALRAGFVVLQDPGSVVTHWGARSYMDGQVRRLVADNYYGIGAFYARQVRRGATGALGTLTKETAGLVSTVALNAVRGRRPTGMRRLEHLIRGAVAGVLCHSGTGATRVSP